MGDLFDPQPAHFFIEIAGGGSGFGQIEIGGTIGSKYFIGIGHASLNSWQQAGQGPCFGLDVPRLAGVHVDLASF